MSELLARLEAATGADREIDARLDHIVYRRGLYYGRGDDLGYVPPVNVDEWDDERWREAAAPEITVSAIEEAFAKASDSGIRYPKLRLDTFVFSPAPAHGKNAGAIYVKEGDDYLGKVVNGKFMCVQLCTKEQEQRIVAAAADPRAAAIAYGKKFGSCCICARELSNPASVELGIGPICAGRYGWV